MGYRGPILFVEDDENDIFLLKRTMKRISMTNAAHFAHNGVEAMEVLRNNQSKSYGEIIQIVLADINMPRMNGLELVRRIRSEDVLKDKIIFMRSTSPLDYERNSFYRMNVSGFFLKDNSEKMIELIKAYCEILEAPTEYNYYPTEHRQDGISFNS